MRGLSFSYKECDCCRGLRSKGSSKSSKREVRGSGLCVNCYKYRNMLIGMLKGNLEFKRVYVGRNYKTKKEVVLIDFEELMKEIDKIGRIKRLKVKTTLKLKNNKCKKCVVCGKALNSNNKSGLCSMDY